MHRCYFGKTPYLLFAVIAVAMLGSCAQPAERLNQSGQGGERVDVTPAISDIRQSALPASADIATEVSEDAVQWIIPLSVEDAVRYEIQSGPAHGLASMVSGLGLLFYTPHADYSGDDSIVFNAIDAGDNILPGTIAITVTPVNDAPTLPSGSFTVEEDKTSSPFVLPGDDVDVGDTLNYEVVTPPAHGELTVVDGVATFVPDADYFGFDFFQAVASDRADPNDADLRQSPVATFSIEITPVNDVPSVYSAELSTSEDQSLFISLALLSEDVDGDSLTWSLVGTAAHGDADLGSEELGLVTYTPNLNFSGTDNFFFRATDENNAVSATGTVTIDVRASNDAPMAQNGNVSVQEDSQVVIELQAADDDSGDTLTLEIARAPSFGAVTLDGQLATYTPTADYAGLDSFEFIARDSAGQPSNTATITVVVNGVNDDPVVSPDSLAVIEDGAVSIALVASDADGPQDALTLSIVEHPTSGTVALSGSLATYTPNANFVGDDSFSFQAQDAVGARSNIAIVAISVTDENDPPVSDGVIATTAEDNAVTIGLIGTDNEDPSTELLFEVVAEPFFGVATVAGSQATYTPNGDYYGPDSFTYRVRDSGGLLSGAATVSITVEAVDDAPMVQDQAVGGIENGTISVTLRAEDADGDGISFELTSKTPEHGKVELSGDAATYTPARDFVGPDRFGYRAIDSTGASSTEGTVTVNIVASNSAPISEDKSGTLREDKSLILNLEASDADDDPLIFEIVEQPANGTVSLVGNSATYNPTHNFNGTDSFTYRTRDDHGFYSLDATVTLVVIPVNDPPVAFDTPDATLEEDTTIVVPLSWEDIDGDQVRVTITSYPAEGEIIVQGTDVFFKPKRDYNGTTRLLFVVSDAEYTSEEAELRFIVTPVDDIPRASDSLVWTREDQSLVLSYNVYEPDGEGYVVEVTGIPEHGAIVHDPADKSYTYTPELNFHGTETLLYRATDNTTGLFSEANVVITIIPQNDNPVVDGMVVETDEDTTILLSPAVQDPDSESFIFSVVDGQGPALGTVTSVGGGMLYTPIRNLNGQDTFSFTANDSSANNNSSTPASITIIIRPLPDPPDATNIELQMSEGTSQSLELSGSDPDGDEITGWAIFIEPLHGTLDASNLPTVIYTPDPTYIGEDAFHFTVTDSTGLTSTPGRVKIIVGDDDDGDGRFNVEDNCPEDYNPAQADLDQDGIGNPCDEDRDGDEVPNDIDVCPDTVDPDQEDLDRDGIGDACDPDVDGDGVGNLGDNCPLVPNPDRGDIDNDGDGEACDDDLEGYTIANDREQLFDLNPRDPDTDGDTIRDNIEFGDAAAPLDSDGDGTIGALDTDSDDDDVTDLEEAGVLDTDDNPVDTDEDDLFDYVDLDSDGDGIPDGDDVSAGDDNCRVEANTDQSDMDADEIGDVCDDDQDDDGIANSGDNCPEQQNPAQLDLDLDGVGDICDDDRDDDEITNNTDNCPLVNNPSQVDTDGNGTGDACDGDYDGDGVMNDFDNCPVNSNSNQADADGDGMGNKCDDDIDGDGIVNVADNCDEVQNIAQTDTDGDGIGDLCDDDADGDGDIDDGDNCPGLPNHEQGDIDGDGEGNACDEDKDGDSYRNTMDNCPAAPNPDQGDRDGDGIGDECDDDDSSGVSGSGGCLNCNAAGGPGFETALLALGYALTRRRRRRR